MERRHYDAQGRLAATIDGLGRVTRFDHDVCGRLVAITDPDGRTTTQSFERAGRVVAVTDADGRTTRYRSTAGGRLRAVVHPEGQVVRRLYDRAVGTAHSPSLAPLAAAAAAHIHPLDLERVGVGAGTEVRLVAPKGSVVLPLVPDTGVSRGSIEVPFNVDGSTVGEIIDATSPAVDVRLERL